MSNKIIKVGNEEQSLEKLVAPHVCCFVCGSKDIEIMSYAFNVEEEHMIYGGRIRYGRSLFGLLRKCRFSFYCKCGAESDITISLNRR